MASVTLQGEAPKSYFIPVFSLRGNSKKLLTACQEDAQKVKSGGPQSWASELK